MARPATPRILITGETGSGPQVFARSSTSTPLGPPTTSDRSTHLACRRRWPRVSCPAIAVEQQVFHRRSSIHALGVIRGASGGTLLLDEIGDLKLAVQRGQLLRFLENNEVHPVGEPRPVAVDVRVIAATNAKIDQRVRDGRFREDLFYRLSIFRLDVPPLRERREEIPILVYHLLQRYATEAGHQPEGVDDEAMKYLLLYAWPGNVRQLATDLTLAHGRGPIGVEHLSPDLLRHAAAVERYDGLLPGPQPLDDPRTLPSAKSGPAG